MMNPAHTAADILKLDVQYLGQNGVKQHLFGNGTPLASHVFDTLEAAVERFGKRIKVEPKHYVQSVNFKQGYADMSYMPRAGMDRVERIEYGMGYLKRLIEKMEATPKPKPMDMRLPHEVMADRAKAAQPTAAPKPAPIVSKAELEASRAAAMAPVPMPLAIHEAVPAPESLEMDGFDEPDSPETTKADMAQSIGQIAKRRGHPPKAK